MFAGVPRMIPSAASRSDAVAASAARHTTSTPPISGSRAPDTTESSRSAVAGDGVWWTIRSRVTASAWWPVAERGSPAGRTLGRPATTRRLPVDMKLEVIAIPVSDVDVALRFYVDQVGFGLDHDARPKPRDAGGADDPARVGVLGRHRGGAPTGRPPGTTRGAQLVVEDIDAARAELAGRGVPISDVQQLGPEGARGSRFAFFDDPDGNGWSLQEIKRA